MEEEDEKMDCDSDEAEGTSGGGNPIEPEDGDGSDWSAEEGEEESDHQDVAGDDDDDEQEEKQTGPEGPPRVYLPGDQEDAEKAGDLVCDESAYTMYHTCGTLLPCLSFDVIPDNLGENRTAFPFTCYAVAGSQAERANKNSLLVMKMSNLTQMKSEKASDAESSDDDSDDEEGPELECAQVRHQGAVNRLKFSRVGAIPLAASFSDSGAVHIWNLTNALRAVDDSRVMSNFRQNAPDYLPLFTFSGHQTEGYALNWSRKVPGLLASGDCNGSIHVWNPVQAGQWRVDQRPYKSHTSSVEDIQWSPTEANVFASCSSDKSIKIWDVRQKPSAACMLTTSDAHTEDVNVIHWNLSEPFLVSGSDAGDIKIWDLRRFATGNSAVAVFRHHRGPVCSVEWHPTDSTVFAAAGEDNQLTQWDIAMEKGEDEPKELESVPPQLLFIHQGQTEIKELHWHPQLPGVILSSALNGIDVFKTISVD